MKKSLPKQKICFSKIPYSKTKSNKINLEYSIKGVGRIFSKTKYDSINKETVDGSCADTQTLGYNQYSLNISKGTINKNYSLGKNDNKIIVFSSSLKNDLDINNKLLNLSKKINTKNSPDLFSENISSGEEDINNNYSVLKNEIKENDSDDEDTNRIDYRYYPKIPEIESNKDNKYFWLATYDKLMKKSKIIKILNYYTEPSPKKQNIIINGESNNIEDKKINNEEYNFKEKSMIIDGYELYFLEKCNKPFIKPKKGRKVFIKLYLLNMEQINKIFSYINRLEYKTYIKNLDTIKEKNYFKIINKSNKTKYNYSTIFCIGSFVNINIFLFSHIEKTKNKKKTKSNLNIKDLPSSNKIAKLIKTLIINFPDYSKEFFIDYLMKPIKEKFELNNNNKELFNQKINEIKSLLMLNKKKSFKIIKKNKNYINNVIKNAIQKIPTYTHSSNKTPDDFYNLSDNNNIFISSLINKDKSNLDNKINSEINNSDFLNNLRTDINIKPQRSEKNFKKTNMNYLINKNFNVSNIQTSEINRKTSNRLVNKDILDKKLEIITNSIRGIELMNPIKKSLTRRNTNKTFIKYNDNKLYKINNINNINNNKILDRIKNSYYNNKENNMNILNSNKFDISISNNPIKTDYRQISKNTRNIQNFNPFYLTNSNNNNNNINNNEQKTRNKKYKKPIRVLSSIRKVISQIMNNMTVDTSNIKTKFRNNSNSSFLTSKNFFLNNNESNNNIKEFNNNKLECKTNNNSQSKKSEYITPVRKKLNIYYH